MIHVLEAYHRNDDQALASGTRTRMQPLFDEPADVNPGG